MPFGRGVERGLQPRRTWRWLERGPQRDAGERRRTGVVTVALLEREPLLPRGEPGPDYLGRRLGHGFRGGGDLADGLSLGLGRTCRRAEGRAARITGRRRRVRRATSVDALTSARQGGARPSTRRDRRSTSREEEEEMRMGVSSTRNV